MGLIELALDVKAGKKKLAELTPGRRKKVERLLDVVEPSSKPVLIHSHATHYARPRRPKPL